MVGDVNYLGIFIAIVDGIPSPPPLHILPDLTVERITFSRSPVVDGQVVEILVYISNLGMTHGRNVDVNIYRGDDLIWEEILELACSDNDDDQVVQINIQAFPLTRQT